MTLTLECRLCLRWQAKLALPSLPASQIGLNKMLAENANSRCCSNQLIPAYFAKNADLVKILGTTFLIFFVFFVPFMDKYPFLR